MGLWFWIVLILIICSLYYGYENKKKYDLKRRTIELEHELKIKEIELEQKKIELEMKKIDNAKLEK